jgi:hypothetical protein
MKKYFCAVVVLLGSLLVFKSAGSQKPSLTAPVIVASGSLTHHNGSFGVAMYTAKEAGTYRVSAYPTITESDPNSQSYWIYQVDWVDPGGPGGAELLLGNGNLRGPFVNAVSGFNQGAPSIVMQVKANTAITHFMSQQGSPDNSKYDLYYVVEQLQ